MSPHRFRDANRRLKPATVLISLAPNDSVYRPDH